MARGGALLVRSDDQAADPTGGTSSGGAAPAPLSDREPPAPPGSRPARLGPARARAPGATGPPPGSLNAPSSSSRRLGQPACHGADRRCGRLGADDRPARRHTARTPAEIVALTRDKPLDFERARNSPPTMPATSCWAW